MNLARSLLPTTAVLAGLAVSPARAQPLRLDYLRRMLPPDTDRSCDIALGDLDGDGDLDAVVANDQTQDRLYLNDGAGVFADATSLLPAFVGPTRSIALGDVDGDGDLDALIGNCCSPMAQDLLYLNNGAGMFTDASVQLPGTPGATADVALGDLDGDGDLDALIGNWGQDRMYLNTGGGIFADVTNQLPVVADQTTAVALGDLDGDGDLDALIGNHQFQNRFFQNVGGGVFQDATSALPAAILPTWALALGDVDGDGDLDALIGTSIGSFGSPGTPNRLFLNNGSGTFTDAPSQIPQVPDDSYAAAFGDADGDGDLDAWIGNSEQQNRFLRNNGSGTFADDTGQLPALQDETAHIEPGDVDGDGDLDLLIANIRQNRLYLNDGSGAFTEATSGPPTSNDFTRAVALGDVDGDGDLDAMTGNTANTGGQQNRLYLNDGSGGFTDATAQIPAILDPTRAVALGDVDGDGDLDALIGNAGIIGQPNRLYLNNGAGFFSYAISLLPLLGLTYTTAVAMGDVDGDGDLDALLGSSNQAYPPSAQPTLLYLNNGTGLFSDATSQLPPIPNLAEAIALCDVEGDGDLDVFVGNADLYFPPGQPDRLYLNNGAGGFTNAAAQLPPILDATLAVALGDLDGDGDLDALLGNTAPCAAAPCPGGQERLYLNNGSGTFLDATGQLPANVDVTFSLALGDFDGDGDLDALIGNWGGSNRFLLNNGSAAFTDATSQLPPPTYEMSLALAAGDLDGDGDLDAFVGNWGQDRVLTNLTRQLAAPGRARLGKPLSLDIYGPPGGARLLAFSLATASIPVPGLGTLRLSPAAFSLHSGGALDAQGRATVTFQVPANPSLLGIPIHWQAGVAPPARFTNLETTIATDL